LRTGNVLGSAIVNPDRYFSPFCSVPIFPNSSPCSFLPTVFGSPFPLCLMICTPLRKWSRFHFNPICMSDTIPHSIAPFSFGFLPLLFPIFLILNAFVCSFLAPGTLSLDPFPKILLELPFLMYYVHLYSPAHSSFPPPNTPHRSNIPSYVSLFSFLY